MKKYILFALLTITIHFAYCQTTHLGNQNIVSADIDNFWYAYDKIMKTKDSTRQLEYLNAIFINKASRGQKSMMEARSYTANEYLDAINNYPKFWNSIRKNTLKTEAYNAEIIEGIKKFQTIYPDLTPSTIYYTMGVFRSPGTGFDDIVLIGSEFALGDKETNTDELPEKFNHIKKYYHTNPVENIQFLNVHEYVHTQQNEMVYNLLSLCLYEGIAEFVASKATAKNSPWPALTYGPNNDKAVKKKFEHDMFNPQVIYNWLWNSSDNEFNTSDLGYYIGYSIANINYDKADDKAQAIKKMIELDYSNEKQIEAFVDNTKFFSSSIEKLHNEYEKSRPRIVSITQFVNKSLDVKPTLTQISLNFSTAMDTEHRGFDFGPLGENNVLRVQRVIGFSNDNKTFTFEVELKPNKRYQSLITNRFISTSGVPLKPFLIDFNTAKN